MAAFHDTLLLARFQAHNGLNRNRLNGRKGRFFPNVRADLSGELFHERRERDSPVELRTLWSSDSLATTLEGRPNVESKPQTVKMSGSTYREVQSARAK